MLPSRSVLLPGQLAIFVFLVVLGLCFIRAHIMIRNKRNFHNMLVMILLSRFDAIIISSEVGYEKPAPEIFQTALGMIN